MLRKLYYKLKSLLHHRSIASDGNNPMSSHFLQQKPLVLKHGDSTQKVKVYISNFGTGESDILLISKHHVSNLGQWKDSDQISLYSNIDVTNRIVFNGQLMKVEEDGDIFFHIKLPDFFTSEKVKRVKHRIKIGADKNIPVIIKISEQYHLEGFVWDISTTGLQVIINKDISQGFQYGDTVFATVYLSENITLDCQLEMRWICYDKALKHTRFGCQLVGLDKHHRELLEYIINKLHSNTKREPTDTQVIEHD